MKPITSITLLGAAVGLAATSPAIGEAVVDEMSAAQADRQRAAVAEPRQTDAAAGDTGAGVAALTIDGRRIEAGRLVGMDVVTPTGDRIGRVVEILDQSETPNHLDIELEEENRQMGIVADNPQKMPGKAEDEPVVVGGSTIALGPERLRLDDTDSALVVDPEDLTTVDNWATAQAPK